MNRSSFIIVAALAMPVLALAGQAAAGQDPVFRSDVSLVRVDVQVLDRDNRVVSGLKAGDFILRDEGQVQPIRSFSREEMPLDLLFLFDVSASMRPHVERIANAAHDALNMLGKDDRVGIMVFDRVTRLRTPFRNSRDGVGRELDRMLDQETFRGGTDITRAMLDAADYTRREGRKEARRAIVILTDDQTNFDRDDARVERALARANTVMSALIAPDAMGQRGYGRRGGGYPGGGMGGPLGGIILGRRGGMGRPMGPQNKSAGTAEIARASGGDSMPVDDADSLETTLSRLRQRYALHFLVPPGVRAGEERSLEVALSDSALRRYPDAEIYFRKKYVAPQDGGPMVGSKGATGTGDQPPAVTVVGAPVSGQAASESDSGVSQSKRRRAISEPDGSGSANPVLPDVGQPAPAAATDAPATAVRNASKSVDESSSTAAPAKSDSDSPPPGKWRKVTPADTANPANPPNQPNPNQPNKPAQP